MSQSSRNEFGSCGFKITNSNSKLKRNLGQDNDYFD
jgi:hypothetical protein